MLNDESSDDDLRQASEFRRVCVVHNFVQAEASVSIMEKRSTLLVLQLPMQQLVIMVIVLMIATSSRFFVSAGGYTGDTYWTPAHATFYGGDDASGTQGELSFCLSVSLLTIVSVVNLQLLQDTFLRMQEYSWQ
jgi:hypothetical protein